MDFTPRQTVLEVLFIPILLSGILFSEDMLASRHGGRQADQVGLVARVGAMILQARFFAVHLRRETQGTTRWVWE